MNFKRNILVGVTHTEDYAPIVREPRVLKVGIGLGPGPALRVYISPRPEDANNPWTLVAGTLVDGKLKEVAHRYKTRAMAEDDYYKSLKTVPNRPYPIKFPYFTFQRPVTIDNREVYEPDWDAIERHGPTPTDIVIVFMNAEPWSGNFAYWTKTELKCHGDGVNAERLISMGDPKDQRVAEAKKLGKKFFPIIDGCYQRGCQYAGIECKVNSSLAFQLASNVRIGGTAHYHTTGFRGTRDIFSSLETIRGIINLATQGRSDIRGIPVHMKLRSYSVKPKDGKASTQYAVRLELDSIEIGKLQQKLISQSWTKPLQIAAATPLIEAEPEVDDENGEVPISAERMAGEFYPENDEDEDDGAEAPAQGQTAEQTTAKREPQAAKSEDFQPTKQRAKKGAKSDIPGTGAPAPETTQAAAGSEPPPLPEDPSLKDQPPQKAEEMPTAPLPTGNTGGSEKAPDGPIPVSGTPSPEQAPQQTLPLSAEQQVAQQKVDKFIEDISEMHRKVRQRNNGDALFSQWLFELSPQITPERIYGGKYFTSVGQYRSVFDHLVKKYDELTFGEK